MSKDVTFVQARLRKGNREQVAWIEKKKGVRIGSMVELKDTGEFWEVIETYAEKDSAILKNDIEMNKDFGGSTR